jgi:hypothetical protein
MEPFTQYLSAVNAGLKERYGVTTDDTGVALVTAGHKHGVDPAECADAIASKYELVELKQGDT